MSNFTIDFFEFSFLVEACIPPRPIARASFWNDVINIYYHQMTPDERANLFDWISRNPSFNPNENNDCLMFKYRFNPDNQYEVTTNFHGSITIQKTFKVNEFYHTGLSTSLIPHFITKIDKINFKKEK